jgi:hypothetical protein
MSVCVRVLFSCWVLWVSLVLSSYMELTIRLDCSMQVSLCENECSEVAALAAETGRLECLKVLWTAGYPLNDATWDAFAEGGHLDTLRYLHEKSPATCGRNATMHAAVGGRLDCLKFLHSVNAPWHTSISNDTARAGQVECLAHQVEHGCPHMMYTRAT